MKSLAVSIGTTFFSPTNGGSRFLSLSSISELVSLFLNITFVIAGLIVMFYFILGGIGLISSAGKGDSRGAEDAKKTVTTAIAGFVVVFTAYWIVKLLGTLLGWDTIL